MSKIESDGIETINAQEAKYSVDSIMAWLCIDAPGYRKLREYVVRNLEFNVINNETLVRKTIASKRIKLNQENNYETINKCRSISALLWC